MSGDDRNEGVEMITTSEARCDKKYQKKPAEEVSEEACDIKNIRAWQGTVVQSMTEFVRDWQHFMLEEFAAQGRAWTSHVVLRMESFIEAVHGLTMC